MSRTAGNHAEMHARTYLVSQGLTWVASNYRAYFGEIDLIMRDKNELVFVEVRARTSSRFGDAAASVTWHKQQKLIKTALLYLQQSAREKHCSARFDVVGLDGVPPVVTWIKHAFACSSF